MVSCADYRIERRAQREGYARVAGIDEAGRGPLAGPVVAAAVILPQRRAIAGLADSKCLSETQREDLARLIVERAEVGIGIVDVATIDRINILQATMLAMAQAAAALPAVELALIDGNRAPALSCACRTIIGGDARVAAIAAASIIAKVTRDRLMRALCCGFPAYGWSRNKGYGTAEHQAALLLNGPTIHHRFSFAPVRAAGAGATASERSSLHQSPAHAAQPDAFRRQHHTHISIIQRG